eukprot:SAG22_NODE_497_length_9790_cov_3.684178_2_plen_130_part_00
MIAGRDLRYDQRIVAVDFVRRNYHSPLIVLLVSRSLRLTATAAAAIAANSETFGGGGGGGGGRAQQQPQEPQQQQQPPPPQQAGGGEDGAAGLPTLPPGKFSLHIFGFGCPANAALQMLCRNEQVLNVA